MSRRNDIKTGLVGEMKVGKLRVGEMRIYQHKYVSILTDRSIPVLLQPEHLLLSALHHPCYKP